MDALYDSLMLPDGMAERVCHHVCLLSAVVDCDDLAQLNPVFCDQIIAGDPDNPYTGPIIDIWNTIEKNAPSEAVYQRLRERWQEWFGFLEIEKKARKKPESLDVETCIQMHVVSAGIRPYPVAIEYVMDIDVGDVVLDPDIERAKEVAVTHGALVNDLYSYRKECFHGDGLNPVHALRRDNYSLQGAIDFIYRRLEALDAEMSELVGTLHGRYARHPLGERLHQYIDNYHLLIAGNAQWHLETPRYYGKGHLWDGRLARHITVQTRQLPIDPL
ncbi:hypothetical protein CER19_13325 [Pseudomonas sp. GL93]|nr:hypothetical protein CER19_13325 [Pseudomonas sp. GL93]